jgi:hypothetical protein
MCSLFKLDGSWAEPERSIGLDNSARPSRSEGSRVVRDDLGERLRKIVVDHTSLTGVHGFVEVRQTFRTGKKSPINKQINREKNVSKTYPDSLSSRSTMSSNSRGLKGE